MEKIYQKRTDSNPEVDFDFTNNTFKITGISIPEFPAIFYKNLIVVIPNYYYTLSTLPLTKPCITIDIEYMNTSSGKMLLYFFQNIGKLIREKNMSFDITWLNIDKEDEDLIDYIETVERIAEVKIIQLYIT